MLLTYPFQQLSNYGRIFTRPPFIIFYASVNSSWEDFSLPPSAPQIQDTWLQVKLILRSGQYIEVDFYIDEVNREIKHHIYVKRPTWSCTTWPSLREHPFLLRSSPLGTFKSEGETDTFAGYTWPSFPFTYSLLFIKTTQKSVDSHQFYL